MRRSFPQNATQLSNSDMILITGTMIPESGGDYAYIEYAFGPLLAFLYLWSALLVIIPAGTAITALTFGYYILQPFWPDCSAPEDAVRLVAAAVICKPNFTIAFYIFLELLFNRFIDCYQLLQCQISGQGPGHLYCYQGICLGCDYHDRACLGSLWSHRQLSRFHEWKQLQVWNNTLLYSQSNWTKQTLLGLDPLHLLFILESTPTLDGTI